MNHCPWKSNEESPPILNIISRRYTVYFQKGEKAWVDPLVAIIPSTFEFGRFLHKKMVNLFVENTRQNPGYACVFLLDIHHLFKHILSANPKRPGYNPNPVILLKLF